MDRAPAPPSTLLENVRAAADAHDWERLRSLCHPDARLVLRFSGGRALSVDDALDVLRLEAEAGAPEPMHSYVDTIDERAAIAAGTVVRETSARYLCWLLTFVDGLLYRQALFGSIGEARSAYAELGVDLGM